MPGRINGKFIIVVNKVLNLYLYLYNAIAPLTAKNIDIKTAIKATRKEFFKALNKFLFASNLPYQLKE